MKLNLSPAAVITAALQPALMENDETQSFAGNERRRRLATGARRKQ